MKKRAVGKKKLGLIEWILIGLVILAIIFLAFKVMTGNVINKTSDSCVVSTNSNSITKTISKYSSDNVNGLNISMRNSHGVKDYYDVYLGINGETETVILYHNTRPQTTIVIGTTKYTIKVISATPTSGTIQVTSCAVCVPKTCSQLGKTCGSVDNTCGTALNCGTCASGKTCTNGNCVAPACLSKGKTCSSATAKCCSNSCRQTMFFGRKWGSPHCR